ncbi:MAG: hypothetical protein ACU833_02520 [Gammaproteobacteria bacterium]
MAVNPTNSRTVLVIHGVQLGDDAGLNQHLTIKELLKNRLGNIPLRYDTDIFKYEDLNDQAQSKFRQLTKLIVATPLGAFLSDQAIDLVGDVVTAKLNTSTAAQIREGFKNKILEIYEAESPCYIIAHSLGSIYAFDVIGELIRDGRFFNRNSRRTWPVQGLVTLGSPIGISLFRKGRPNVASLGDGTKWLRWINYWDRNDPVVSGSIFGKTLTGFDIAAKYLNGSPKQGWVIRDIPVDTGKVWLPAHVAYWENPMVGDGLVDLLTN